MATQSITAPKPMIDPKDELIAELTGALKAVRSFFDQNFKDGKSLPVLDALITKGEMGVQ